MLIFNLTLLSTFLLSLMARIGRVNLKPNALLTGLIALILILVSGLRLNIGDTGAYIHLYKLIVLGQNLKGSYEAGFLTFLSLLSYVSTNPQFMLFVTALFTNGLYIWVMRHYSSIFELQIYMFITSGYYLVTMNGVRQALAAAILFAGTKLIVEGKFKKYLLLTLFVSTLHTSALIMIPVYFLVRQEPWSKKITSLLLLIPVVFVLFPSILEVIFKVAESSRYGYYGEVISSGKEGGANIIRVFVATIPVIMAYLGRQKLQSQWSDSSIFVNMSLLNLIFMVFSLHTWLFARFVLYFQPYNFILLPYIIGKLFYPRQRYLVYYLFLVLYFVYFYYEQAIVLNINYISNYIRI